MATKILKLKGTVMWARVFEDTRDMYEFDEDTGSFTKPSSCGGTYSLDLVVDDATYRELKLSGSLAAKNSKLNDAGEDVVRFKRQHEKIGKGGKLLEFASGAPQVIDGSTGLPWDLEKQGNIGNGSEVEVEIAVYTTKFSPGTRLEKVTVLNFVPVETKEEEAA